ncbi:DNA-binding protein [Actinoplanes sp. LDG1-06]|uniref:DNA-binding protein n=1 Tax=Paractinoplanes ovalisporus TaxID=2810368 RepID=A0ABS2AKZ6_9ACTN|nr:PPC domain-containing DNA-binding protein [Actinoplanes ovalisporus]MBM2620465.1 DNA-binding protein [Actinoplanes ovalisporus]
MTDIEYFDPAKVTPTGSAPGVRVQLLSESEGRQTYLVALSRGDEVATALNDFARAYKVGAGHFTAIGALRDVRLGWYDLHRKQYKVIPIPGQVEALSLIGDFGTAGDQPIVHCHMVVGLEDASVRGGHLVYAIVSPTLEVTVTVEPATVAKKYDDHSGLTLMNLPDRIAKT